MRQPGAPDCFVVINGPEDGAEFFVTRAPIYIGQDPHCAVNLRLDAAVRPYHARITAVSDGYRIRSIGGAPTYVDDKRVGALRSRILRSGSVLQAGHTLLTVECAQDGLAVRSGGIVAENDLTWAVQQGSHRLLYFVGGCLRLSFRVLGRVVAHWQLAIFAAAVFLYAFHPPFQQAVDHLLSYIPRYFQTIYELLPQAERQ